MRSAAIGVTIAVAVSSVVGAFLVVRTASANREQSLETDASIVFDSVEEGFRRVERDLLALQGLFASSEEVTAAEFHRFVATMHILDQAFAVAVAEAVPHADLASFNQAQALHTPGFEIFSFAGDGKGPPPDSQTHYPIIYFAHQPVVTDGTGFDLSSVPEPRLAIEKALRTGLPSSTGLFELALAQRTGFLIIVPIPRRPEEPPRVLVAAHAVEEFITQQVPPSLLTGLEVHVDAATTADLAPDERLSRSTVLEAGGRLWSVGVVARPEADYLTPPWEGPLGYGVALLVTVLVGWLTTNRVRHRFVLMALDAERQVNRAKDGFLASVSHQMRTPLAAVSGFLKELRESWDELGAADRIEFLRIADEQADEMAWLMHNLLVATRAESGLASVKAQPCNLNDLTRKVIASLPDTGDRSLVVEDGETWAFVDPLRTHQIIRNLLVNAFEHGGPHIEIRFTSLPEAATIEIRDNGEGVDPSVLPQVFDLYAHTESSLPLGTIGLGLYVSKYLAELMGGALDYRRDASFTIFSLRLPAGGELSRGAGVAVAIADPGPNR